MAKAYIKSKDETATEAACQDLLSQFSDHVNLPEAVCDIAECLMKSHYPEKAAQFYEYAMNTWPDYNLMDEEYVILHRKNLLQLKLSIGDDDGADAICDYIINNFSDADTFPKLIEEITDAYVRAGKYDRAAGLSQYTLDRWSGTKYEIWAVTEMFKSDIALGRDPNNEGLDELIIEFGNDVGLTEAMLKIAEGCYQKAFERENTGSADEARRYFENTITACQRTMERLPEYTAAPLAATSRHFIGNSYCRLGRLDEALQNYLSVVV
ncbi:MAG: tetratricopeptide repeat protein [Planctomycetota bacterium]